MSGSRRLDLLLVDDNALVTRALARELRDRHEVRAVRTIAEAEEALRARAPDVLICDYALDRERGSDLLATVALLWPGVGRVIYSGSVLEESARLVAQGLAHRALVKPAPLPEILDALDRVAALGLRRRRLTPTS